jgi:hypothetical protein
MLTSVSGSHPRPDLSIERCDREIVALKAEARAGNPDVHGLMLALHDWRTERRLILKRLETKQTK